MAAAIIFGSVFALHRAARRELNGDLVVDALIWGVIGAIIGARLYYVIFYGNWSEIFQIWTGGLAIYGGIIGGAIGVFIQLTVNNEQRTTKDEKLRFSYFSKEWWKTRGKAVLGEFLRLGDVFAPCLLLGQAVGRWGNFINEEAHGGPTNSFLRMTIYEGGQLVSVHPTFLYESIWCLVGIGIILLAERTVLRSLWGSRVARKALARDDGGSNEGAPAGVIFLLYIAWYGLGRTFIEGLRTDSLMLGSLRVSQWLAAISFVLAIWGIWRILKRNIK